MNFVDTLKSSIYRMVIISLSTTCTLHAASAPIQVSPVVPGYADPMLVNNQTVVDNYFQLPFYPGSTPYLNLMSATFNLFLFPLVKINPCDDRIVTVNMTLDQYRDSSGVYARFNPWRIFNLSKDGGFTWENNFQPYVQATLPLGGTVSQRIGSSSSYDKCGTLLSASAFNDLNIIPPRTIPASGIFFSASKDNGITWSDPIIVDTAFSSAFNVPKGPNLTGAFPLAAPDNCNLIHIAYSNTLFPISPFTTSIMYVRSTDAGKTWSAPKEIYNLVNDPVWVAQHADPNFFPIGGEAFFDTNFIAYDENILLVPFRRIYPKIGSPVFTQNNLDTNFDQAVVRSFDKGKTWDPVAGATPQFLDPFVHDPAGNSVPPFTGNRIFSGNLATFIVRSPITGRVYITYQAGNTNISQNPTIAEGYPCIVLNASNDIGATWSKTVQVNQTPTNIPIGAQQAFWNSMAIGANGEVVICYYDFRNWNGEGPLAPLPTDAWMDIYNEVPDPNGGSTGVGLDFVRQVRLTPTSFDARISLRHGLGTRQVIGLVGFGTDVAINQKNEALAVFGTTHFTPQVSVIGYKGMNMTLNNVINLEINRVQLPRASNQ